MQNIVENNRLMAEFMGGKYDKDVSFPIHRDDIWLPVHGICRHNTIKSGYGKRLCYHESWEWLMPVAEKIQSTKTCDIEICLKGLVVFGYDVQTKRYAGTLIDELYRGCVEFIRWYNTQTK